MSNLSAKERARELLMDRALAASAAQMAAGGTNDEVITIAPYLPEWTLQNYAAEMVGGVWVHEGVPYKLGQAHDATHYPSETPRTLPALWWAYHGGSTQTALPWQAPTGGHDIYKAGEMMIWTDGWIYRCVQDTAYSPEGYARAWERVE